MSSAPMDAELRLAPRPDLVRTVRLVVASAARRAGVHEDLLDEVRLAVGEAAAGAVVRLGDAGRDDPVLVRWQRSDDSFDVEVSDSVPRSGAPGALLSPGSTADVSRPGAVHHQDDDLSLAVVAGLVTLNVERTPTGRTVRMTWLLDADAGADAATDTGVAIIDPDIDAGARADALPGVEPAGVPVDRDPTPAASAAATTDGVPR